MLANVKERLAESKQAAHNLTRKEFDLRKLNKL
jgi:hypothetical protein